VADEIRMKVSDLLLREVRDPRVRGAHLTGVRMSDDLSVAHLAWRPSPGGPGAEAVGEGLRAAAGFLRRELARSLDLRHVPELHFHLDELPDEAERVERLLDQLRSGAPTDVDPDDEG
jgi:ribosome-binding factor A